MAAEPVIQSLYNKRMAEMMMKQYETLGAQNSNVETMIGAGFGALKAGIGIAGLFQDTPEFQDIKSEYQKDPNLQAAANIAMSKAVGNADDYASRIRIRNQRAANEMKAISMSGGDRNFVAANIAAGADVENIANLTLDKQLSQEQTANMSAAANLQQLALFDRLNESRDKLGVAELNMKGNLAEIEMRNKNTAGAATMIASGVNDIAGAGANKITNDANREFQRIMLLNAMSKINMGEGTGLENETLEQAFNKTIPGTPTIVSGTDKSRMTGMFDVFANPNPNLNK